MLLYKKGVSAWPNCMKPWSNIKLTKVAAFNFQISFICFSGLLLTILFCRIPSRSSTVSSQRPDNSKNYSFIYTIWQGYIAGVENKMPIDLWRKNVKFGTFCIDKWEIWKILMEHFELKFPILLQYLRTQ